MRPLVKDGYGTVRFRSNAIVERLLEASQKQGFGLNELTAGDYTQADWEEFYQLIGYSLKGYHELSLVSDLTAFEASKVARAKFTDVSGCRDHGCEIHCGVSRKP